MINNYDKICKVKGKTGLYNVINKRGSSLVVSRIGYKLVMQVESYRCVILGDLIFSTELGKPDLTIQRVFENISKIPDLSLPSIELIDLIVPNYDESQFKEHDVYTLLNWYKILKENEKKN